MNLSVETQQEVIFLEDLCMIFLLSMNVSTCLKMRFRHPKISKFSREACPRTPLAMPGTALPAGLPLSAKNKNLVYGPVLYTIRTLKL